MTSLLVVSRLCECESGILDAIDWVLPALARLRLKLPGRWRAPPAWGWAHARIHGSDRLTVL